MEFFGYAIPFLPFVGVCFLLLIVGFYFVTVSVDKNRRRSSKKWTSIIDPKGEAKVTNKEYDGWSGK